MNQQDINNYIALFNNRQYDQFTQYYADDVVYVMDALNNKVFHGPQAIRDLYQQLHHYFDEELSVDNIAFGNNMIALEVDTLLHCKVKFDLPGFVPIDKGKTCHMMCFNHYDLNSEGKICRIRVAIQSMEYS